MIGDVSAVFHLMIQQDKKAKKNGSNISKLIHYSKDNDFLVIERKIYWGLFLESEV